MPSPDGQFSFEQSGISVDCPQEENLCVKAYRLLETKYKLPAVHMLLHKQIPFGAGLGGGSADASAVLMLLNRLFDLKLDNEQLHAYALQLGADCPFFIYNQPAFVSGIGDKIQLLDSQVDSVDYQLVLLKPEVFISTKEAFSGVHISGKEITLDTFKKHRPEKWKTVLENDFEHHLFQLYPQLEQLKNQLYDQGALYASMTGSGSALYGIFSADTVLQNSAFSYLLWQGKIRI